MVLVAEDHQINVHLILAVLEAAGCETQSSMRRGILEVSASMPEEGRVKSLKPTALNIAWVDFGTSSPATG